MNVDAITEEALNAHLATLATAQALPVAWANVPFTPTANKGYFRPSLLTARTVQASLGSGGDNRHSGIYQVSVFWPENKAGIPARSMAGVIAEHFKLGTRLTRGGIIVRINAPPWGDAAQQEAGWYHVPVSIPYQVDVSNGELP